MFDFKNAFMYCVDVSTGDAELIVQHLMTATPNYAGGSSFAVTSELHLRNMRRVYLSPSSYIRVRQMPKKFNVRMTNNDPLPEDFPIKRPPQ